VGEPSPLSAELLRFPPPDVVRHALSFNRACYYSFRAQQAVRLHRWQEYHEAPYYLDTAWIAWNALDSCQSLWDPDRDDYLITLRTALGDEAFFTGRMPPPVPYWLFVEID